MLNMKKILVIAMTLVLCQGALFAQKGKAVAEKDVKVNYVKDFQRQVKEATNIQWWMMDSLTYKVTYLDEEKSRQAMVFNNKGSETHYYVDKQYYPAAIRDTVSHLFPKYEIQDVWVRKARGKMTYQAWIAKMSGILWWRKAKDSKIVNWEVTGSYINAE